MQTIKIQDYCIDLRRHDVVVVGSGAAGYSCLYQLLSRELSDVALVTEGRTCGTSRNTGSDKQTYYKLTVSGAAEDSVEKMAETLFAGGAVQGSHALVEAASSLECFYNLKNLGVPFPHNRYGEYLGYKTDHDPRERASSVGPYTSKLMTECLERAVKQKGAKIYDMMQLLKIDRSESGEFGLLCLKLHERDLKEAFSYIETKHLVLATGGPAGLYEASVYPKSQFGATGLALEVGAEGQNLTEWQYGLTSLAPRWNVSGTYMQALPRFLSCDATGEDEREFLGDFFGTAEEALNLVFLKGYQWPFDVQKLPEGSSLIDVLVYNELQKGRRVFLDYRSDAFQGRFDLKRLSPEAYAYLRDNDALIGPPIRRLAKMNQPAIDFYRDHKLDLATEKLEISLSAQHNNGGIAVDEWWESSVPHLYVIGEAAGTHGIYRPGGSALNAGQVGALRAAQKIHYKLKKERKGRSASAEASLSFRISDAFANVLPWLELLPQPSEGEVDAGERSEESDILEQMRTFQAAMSLYGGPFRDLEKLADLQVEVRSAFREAGRGYRLSQPKKIRELFKYRQNLITWDAYIEAMLDFIRCGGGSRGSAIYLNGRGRERLPLKDMRFAFNYAGEKWLKARQLTRWAESGSTCRWEEVQPIPSRQSTFEQEWKNFRENKIYED